MDQSYDPIGEANERLRNSLAQLKHARQVQKVFMGLGREMNLRTSPEEILEMIVEAVRSLFSNAYYLVQLTDPKTLMPTSVDFRGPLHANVASKIHLTRPALRKTGLDPAIGQSSAIELVDTPPTLFEGSRHAIHVPLVADQQLFGAIQLEGHEAAPLGDDDEVLLISLANQLALAIRNQRLLEETAYLKDYLASVLEQANALIIVTDMNRQILVFNEAMERLLGFPKNETLGTDLFQWLPLLVQESSATEISHTLAGEPSAVGVDTRMRSRDGELVQILCHLSALRDRDGEVDSLILVGQDLTQIRALEAQIIETEKMASLGKLAAGVVHELNNPLTSISVYAEFLLKKLQAAAADPGDRAKMEKILEGAQRIQKLTRDLVSYGRPAAEEPELLQLNDLVAQGLSFCEHTIRKYDVQVSTDLEEHLPQVVANRNQLLQVIINLITNSCQAMEGGGELALSTRSSPDELTLTLADTGCGIPAKDLHRIFEPFYTTKKAGQGTGLGLSIVSRIIEHHRGQISVDSTLGEGTSFRVTLPCKSARRPAERINLPATDPDDEERSRGEQGTP